jgi:hypothetical protein
MFLIMNSHEKKKGKPAMHKIKDKKDGFC